MNVSKLVQNALKAPKGVTDLCAASVVADEAILALKKVCKNDERAIEDVVRFLLLDLANRSVIVRLRSLGVIDSLFLRSRVFRKGISSNIRTIAECAGLLGGKVIENIEQRDALQHRVKELLETWDLYYGEFLPEVRAITRHMREFLHLVMPNIEARAIQHAAELEKKQKISVNKGVARGQQVLLELKSEGLQCLSLQEIRSSLSELKSCFSILFPGVTAFNTRDNIEASSSSSSRTIIASSVSYSNNLNEESWECDGQEIEEVDDENDDDEDVQQNIEDDDDDVDWEDAKDDDSVVDHAEDDDDGGGGGSRVREMNIAPFTLEIRIPMTAAGMENDDNAVVMQALREITSHLTTHALPVLREWREALSAALGCYNHDSGGSKDNSKENSRENSREISSSSSNKRKRDTDSSVENNIPQYNSKENEVERTNIAEALREVCTVDDEVRTILRTRCSTLLSPKGDVLS